MNQKIWNAIKEIKEGHGQLDHYVTGLKNFSLEELRDYCDSGTFQNVKLNELMKGKYPYISEIHARNTIQELLNRLETGMSYTWYGAKGIYKQVEKTFIRRSNLPTSKEGLIDWYGEDFITDDVVKFVKMLQKGEEF